MIYHDIEDLAIYKKLLSLRNYWVDTGANDISKLIKEYRIKWNEAIRGFVPYPTFIVDSYYYNKKKDCIELQGMYPYNKDTIRVYKGKYIMEFK